MVFLSQGTSGNDGPPGPPGERVSPEHYESKKHEKKNDYSFTSELISHQQDCVFKH